VRAGAPRRGKRHTTVWTLRLCQSGSSHAHRPHKPPPPPPPPSPLRRERRRAPPPGQVYTRLSSVKSVGDRPASPFWRCAQLAAPHRRCCRHRHRRQRRRRRCALASRGGHLPWRHRAAVKRRRRSRGARSPRAYAPVSVALPAGLGQSLPVGRLPKVGWSRRRPPSSQSKPVVWAASVVRGRHRSRRLAQDRVGRVLLPRRARWAAASPCV
jgi:hypothetical protein